MCHTACDLVMSESALRLSNGSNQFGHGAILSNPELGVWTARPRYDIGTTLTLD